MTDPIPMLIEKLEATTGEDRRLGFDIDRSLTAPNYPDDYYGWYGHDEARLNPVLSTDAALALVERKLPGVWWIMSKGKLSEGEALFACQLLFGADESLAIEDADTLPIAILLALLRALQSSPQDRETTV